MSKDTKNKGMPIYLDKTPRAIADSLEDVTIDAWYPSNRAAHQLWRCLEAMRDLEVLLEDVAGQKNATKKKRKLKIATTPLYSLILSLNDFCNNVQSNEETRFDLNEPQITEILKIQKKFTELLPHNYQSEIKTIRNKLSAHTDKKLLAYDAQKLSKLLKPIEFYRWLCISINLVIDITNLNIYKWSCQEPEDGYMRFMHQEPFVITIQTNSPNGARMVSMNVANSSPRNTIIESVEKLLHYSMWMSSDSQSGILKLVENRKEEWSSFIRNSRYMINANKS